MSMTNESGPAVAAAHQISSERFLPVGPQASDVLLRGLRARGEAERLPIAAVQSLSSTAFPGHLAAVVSCGDAGTAPRTALRGYSWRAFQYFLGRWQRMLTAVVFRDDEAVSVSALAGAMGRVRDQGFKVALYTRGSRADRLALLQPLADWVSLEVNARGGAEASRAQIEQLRRAGANFECRSELERILPQSLERTAHGLACSGVRAYSLHLGGVDIAAYGELWARIGGLFEAFALREQA